MDVSELTSITEDDTEALIEAFAKLIEARAAALGEPAVGSDLANTMREAERCFGCDLPFLPGDLYHSALDGGFVHDACAGSPDGFANGERPEPGEWQWDESELPSA